MSEPRQPAGKRGPSIGRRLSIWLRRHTSGVAKGLLTLIVAPIIVLLIASRLPLDPSTVPGPTSPTAPLPTGSSVPTETEIRYFRPFTDEGLPPDYQVVQVEGECFGTSMTSADPSALRCAYSDETGSPIVDPCWVSIDRTQVACTLAPWDRSVTLIDPVLDLYEDPEADGGLVTPDPERDPFAMEVLTADGELYRCTAIAAYAGDVAGYRRNYECDAASEGPEQGSVFGNTDRSRSVWRVRFATGSSAELTFAHVVRVWM